MSRLRAFAIGVYEFVVGDDWRVAIGVVVAIGITALAASAGVTAWWILPVGVLTLLTASLRRATRG